jgi:DNA modification methylase
MVLTSPPYFQLRDYGYENQIGLEPSIDAYVAALVGVFREVRRVLRDDGLVFLNLGDSYANDAKWGGSTGGKHVAALHGNTGIGRNRKETGLGPKQLLGVPWRVALALQADGWYLRSDMIWHKSNCMPESVRDRPTCAHEYVFVLAKRPRYFWDAAAVRQKFAPGHHAPGNRSRYDAGRPDGLTLRPDRGEGCNPSGRNLRSVLTIPTSPFKGAHFAVMSARLAALCIRAGSSKRGCCPHCGSPWLRAVKRRRVATRPGVQSKVYAELPVHPDSPVRRHNGDVCGNRDPQHHCTETRTVGWAPSCRCPEHTPVPCVCFDPFAGAGTTVLVATALGRHGVGCDLSHDYLLMARDRVERPHRAIPRPAPAVDEELPLFRKED